jgi:hypothetical protein
MMRSKDYSENTAQEIDAEVKRIIGEANRTAIELIETNRDKLELIAKSLLDGVDFGDDALGSAQLQKDYDKARPNFEKAVDLEKDRVYLPEKDLSQFQLSVDDLKPRRASDSFKRLMKFEVERTRRMFARGKPLCTSVSGRLGLELRSVWLGGMRILDHIEKNGYDVFASRPVITSTDKLKILLVAASKRAFRRY